MHFISLTLPCDNEDENCKNDHRVSVNMDKVRFMVSNDEGETIMFFRNTQDDELNEDECLVVKESQQEILRIIQENKI